MITEIAVAEMGIQVVYHGRMVGEDVVVGAHITAAEDITRGRIHLMMILPNGIQVPRKGMIIGVISQVLKFKTLQVGKLSLVVGTMLELKMEVAVVGAKQVLLLTMGVLAGDLFPRAVVLGVGLVKPKPWKFYSHIQGIAVGFSLVESFSSLS